MPSCETEEENGGSALEEEEQGAGAWTDDVEDQVTSVQDRVEDDESGLGSGDEQDQDVGSGDEQEEISSVSPSAVKENANSDGEQGAEREQEETSQTASDYENCDDGDGDDQDDVRLADEAGDDEDEMGSAKSTDNEEDEDHLQMDVHNNQGSDAEYGQQGADSDQEDGKDKLVEDIFGESDDGEFEGFADEDVTKSRNRRNAAKKARHISYSEDERLSDSGRDEEQAEVPPKILPELSDEDEADDAMGGPSSSRLSAKRNAVSDFELMMARKKKPRRRKNEDVVNNDDDLIADLLVQMQMAAEEDRELYHSRQPATKKLKLLPLVESQLQKQHLKVAFLDQEVLSVLSDWLVPSPDRHLPHVRIREVLLCLLNEFPPIDQSLLKSSGIGKAVMFLSKHPQETKKNRALARKLVQGWARTIFKIEINLKNMSREEREERDLQNIPKRQKLSIEETISASGTPSRDLDNAIAGDGKALGPGDPGWIGRARVPKPSTKDYVFRPKADVNIDFTKGEDKKVSRLEKIAKKSIERRKMATHQPAVSISLVGNKMPL